MRPFIHLIADYGIGDPAFAEVIARLKRFVPEAEVMPMSVPPFSTLATGFWIGQLGLYDPPEGAVIYANTAPRNDNTEPRDNNEGEPLVYVRLQNGVQIVSPFAGYCFSFVRDDIVEFRRLLADNHGSQFRSRDIYPKVVAQIAQKDHSVLGTPLPIHLIPAIPANRIAFVDGYGNIKTTIRQNKWRTLLDQASELTTITINGITKQTAIANGIFSVTPGSLVIAPGSSGGENPFLEISKRAGSAARVFDYPPLESTVIIRTHSRPTMNTHSIITPPMNKNTFYITAAIPYVNGQPHVGHALEFVQADVIARYQKLLGRETLYVSGSDENGLKIVQAAQKQGLSPQELADNNTQLFLNLVRKLNVNIGVWRRGSDRKFHWPGTEKLWRLGEKSDDIYKKEYGGFYCVGCEDFYTKKDLVDGKCPEHLKVPEWVEEENYFFRLSKYQEQIETLITSNELLVIPSSRKNEVLAFIQSGLKDFSISRSRQRAKNWGIPVPGDDSQIVYTWYDGLNIYQTAVGFGYDENLWRKWWPADLHVIGKGIVRFHAVYWIGMLLSAKLPLPKSIFVHGYISSEGHKMSKSLGNVIDPFEVVEKYGAEAIRYYLLREIPSYADGDFSDRRFKELYNADLANGLGNLVARVAKLAQGTAYHLSLITYHDVNTGSYKKALEEYRFNDALGAVWEKVKTTDKYIDENEPWKLTGGALNNVLEQAITQIVEIATLLQPFLPETSEKILKQFTTQPIQPQLPIFPRIA